MRKERANESAGKPRKKPTFRQMKFAAAYIDPRAGNGNGVAAARAAGYQGGAGQLAVQASTNLRNANVQELINEAVGTLMKVAMRRLAESLNATTTKIVFYKGEFVTSDPVPDHRVRLAAIALLVHLGSKCAAAPAEIHEVTPATRQEAVEAAVECLQTFAPDLLAATAAVSTKAEPDPSMGTGEADGS